jgi:hypothetical protein
MTAAPMPVPRRFDGGGETGAPVAGHVGSAAGSIVS